MEEKKAQA